MLTLNSHPHMIAVPRRAVHLARILDLLMARADTIFVTSSTVADGFAAVSRPDGA